MGTILSGYDHLVEMLDLLLDISRFEAVRLIVLHGGWPRMQSLS